jgi:hypothetical protein
MVAMAAVAVAFGPTGFPPTAARVGVTGGPTCPVGVIIHTDSRPPGVAVENGRLVEVGGSRWPMTSATGPHPAITVASATTTSRKPIESMERERRDAVMPRSIAQRLYRASRASSRQAIFSGPHQIHWSKQQRIMSMASSFAQDQIIL